ncbi:MAG: hypothetical protein RL262_118, partial [Bacteroidota bacterium]
MRYFVYKFILILIIVTKSISGFSQDFSNKGKEFWVGYGSHVNMYNARGIEDTITGGTQNMVLYFTSDRNATVTVEIPNTSPVWKRTYQVTANKVTVSDTLPKYGAEDARLTKEGKSIKGIHVVADANIIAYAHIYNGSISGASLLFPVTTLARDYYSINFTQVSNSANSYCYSYVIATEDNTNIEIIPSANTFNNLKGDTIRVLLNKGEVYNIFGKVTSTTNPYKGEDLTGTRIRSVATATSACKKIAVFSGSGKLSLNCSTGGAGSADNYIQQAFPSNAWGRKYLTVPTNKMPNNFYRIAVSDPKTVVKVNGLVLANTSLINNFYYEFTSSTANSIVSDLPIMVAQYITTTSSCFNLGFSITGQPLSNTGQVVTSNGDPEMIYLSPIEQTIDKVTINSTGNAAIYAHYVNIVIPKNGASTLKIDGVVLTGAVVHPADTNYLYFQPSLTTGSHTISSDSGFNAIAYGFGNVESYGYNAGANVKDLNQQLTVENKYATVQLPITCKGTVFTPSITLPYMPLSLKWVVPKYDTIFDYAPVADSSYISVTGKLIFKFTLKAKLKYDSVGTYNIEIVVNNPTADGCSGEQLLNFDLLVTSAPKVDNKIITSHCISDSVTLNDNTLLASEDRNLSSFIWKVEGGVQGNAKIFKFLPNRAGKYIINYFVINDVGCISDTISKEILIDSLPKVIFGTSAFKCQNQEITFTDSSTARGAAVLKQLAWNFGDYSSVDTIDISKKSVVHSFDSLRNYTVSLAVITENGCIAKQSQIIKNNPIPQVGFILPEVCLLDPFAQFKDTTKIADLSNNFRYKWNFGDASNTASSNTDTIQNPKHRYVNTGDYTVSLKVTSLAGCVASNAVKFTVNGTFPNANFKVLNDTALCSNKEVEIINKSTIDIGSIGKMIIFWDYDRNIADTTVDQNPSFDKSYKHLYKNFEYPGKMNFTIKIMAYSGGICADDTATSIVIVPPPTGISISSNKDYACMFDTLSFRASMQGGIGPFSYQWKTDNAAAVFNTNVLNGVNAGNVKIAVTAKDIKQCTYDYDNLKLLEVKSIPTAILKAKDTVICNEDPVTLKGEGNYLFNWMLNDAILYASKIDTFSTMTEGVYKLKVNDGQCNSLLSDPIYIRKLVIPKYTLSYNPTICINTPLALNTNANDAKNIYFKWDFGDTKIFDKAKAINHSYAATGSYIVKLAITNDYCPKYEQFLQGDSVKVVSPILPSTFTLFVLADIDTVLTPLRKDPGYTQFEWYPSTYLSNASIEHPLFRSNKSINYTLTRTEVLTACKVEDIYKMDVSDLVVVSIPKAFTPNRDNLNDFLKIEYGAGLKTFNFLRIFNRFGKIVFQTNRITDSWDGRFNGL